MARRKAKTSVTTRPLYSRQFSLVSVGPGRSEEQIRREVNDAKIEATQDYVEEVVATQRLEGFLAGGVESLWLFAILPGVKAAGLGFAGALGKKAADKLYELFEKKLRKHNLLPKAVPGNRGSTKQLSYRSQSTRRSKPTRKS